MEKKAAMKQTVVLYNGGGVGHVVPMAELAKSLIRHGYDVTMVLLEPPFKSSDSDTGAAVVECIAASNPSISFHTLPPLPAPDFANIDKHPFLLFLQLLRQYNERLETFLRSIPRQRLHSLVVDMFCVAAIDVCVKLRVPVYTFFASGASVLSALTQLPTELARRQTSLKELGDTPLDFLGLPPFPASHFIREMVELPAENELIMTIMDVWKSNTDTMGVLVNTFEFLESRAVQAFRDPLCVPGRVLPPMYCVGPLIRKGAHDDGKTMRHECLAWLDAQPEKSVVFLCFGSKGAHSENQLKEMATGLERSGQGFLWTVRTPTSMVDPKRFFLEQRPEPDLDALLPEGFLERTKDRGLVIKSWAPQVDVLRHPSTGAFVTHCGWNSTLEGITAGVPMLCWPLSAEQFMNKVFMTEDLGVAVELEGYRSGFINAEELEAKVRLVMKAQEGKELRARVAAMQKEAGAALEEGGSSEAALIQFLSDVECSSASDEFSTPPLSSTPPS